jgi:glucokinase
MSDLAIGIDLGGTKIGFAVVDPSGRIIFSKRISTEAAQGAFSIIDTLAQEITDVQASQHLQIKAVGIGVAGQVEAETGVVKFAPNLKWHQVPLRDELAKKVNLPIEILGDVRSATYGEWKYGAGKGCGDLVCVFIGTGIGGGIVSQGQLVSGHSNTAGEVGHMIVDLNGPKCTCGSWGCVEAFAGGWAIASQAKKFVQEDSKAGAYLLNICKTVEHISAKDVAQGALEGDLLCQKVIEQAIHAVIAGCVNIVNILNPKKLVIGGGVVKGIPSLLDEIQKGIHKRALAAAHEGLKVMCASLGEEAGAIGAAAYALDHCK